MFKKYTIFEVIKFQNKTMKSSFTHAMDMRSMFIKQLRVTFFVLR